MSAVGVLRTVALSARAAVFLLPWLIHLFIADVLLSVLLPVSAVAPTLAYDVSSSIAASVWYGIQLILTRINGAKIVVSGAEQLPAGESAIVVSNHVEWADFYSIQEIAIQKGMLGRCRYFAKQQLKWVPFLGWGLWAMGMPLVSRNWMSDQKEMDRVFRGVVQRRWPMWLISFSEATRYTASKRAAAEKWCATNHRKLGKHVLYPRVKGFCACVQQLRQSGHVRAVYDITILYMRGDSIFQKPPSFWQTLSQPRLSEKWKIYVHVNRHALDELPMTDEDLTRWLEDRWVEKGERLESWRQELARKAS
ncbi:Putative phospholipid/glycerol acyltransferase [Septoria linicola]|uniref:Phospholipid/glycerol acyltransferase n=1 Tax=Septoria linicola TaxID=215465 RepID=A0A9Q9EE79_9PEZI|nr:putative phospholipid/glycerol acyltransferase [Septoria linicola]USW48496.1 Putative phospholipid/glycerol acyltransferase [Septoria linicola]